MLRVPEVPKGSAILVLFPERHLSRLIQVNLERQGFKVWTAETAAEAATLALQHKPVLLIIDGELDVEQVAFDLRGIPGCDGLRVLPFRRDSS